MRIVGLRGGSAVLVAVAVALVAALPARAAMTLERVPVNVPGAAQPWIDDVAPTPDGSLAVLLTNFVVRRDAAGRTTVHALPSGVAAGFGASLTPLVDGSMELLAARFPGDAPSVAHLVRVRRDGARFDVVPVPASSGDTDWKAAAIAPDGSLWRARPCAGVLSRTSPQGVERRIHLRPWRCGAYPWRIELGATFAFGPDGSVWFASPCQARVVRVPLVGRPREWRYRRRPDCAFGIDRRPARRALAPLHGGLLLRGVRITPRGRIVAGDPRVPDAITPDGTEWRVTPQGVDLRPPAGGRSLRTDPLADHHKVIAWASGPDGRFWYVSAHVVDELSAGIGFIDQRIGAIDAAGHVEEQALGSLGSDALPQLVAGPDGDLWIAEGPSLIRVATVPPLGPGAAPRARVVRVVARRDLTAWVELACSARPGAFCAGHVRLVDRGGHPLSRGATPFAVPGGEGRAVPVALTRAAAGRRRLAAHVRVTAARR